MATETLGGALEREHTEIDAGIAAFATALAAGEHRTEPLLNAVAALRRHIYLEEVMLFPSLKEAGMAAPVFVMLREHGAIWKGLDELETGVATGADPAALLATCKVLAAQLETHNMKEEAILYPRADGVLTATASAELHEFLATGQMPPGWTCAQGE